MILWLRWHQYSVYSLVVQFLFSSVQTTALETVLLKKQFSISQIRFHRNFICIVQVERYVLIIPMCPCKCLSIYVQCCAWAMLTQKAPDAYHINKWIFIYLIKLHLLNMNRNWTAIISIQIEAQEWYFIQNKDLIL